MIRYLHWVPLIFTFLSFSGCLYGITGGTRTAMETIKGTWEPGQTRSLKPQVLRPGLMYTITVNNTGAYRDGLLVDWVVSAEDDEGEDLFELEDGWWSESGTWSEGGESGTWHEENTQTWFNFRVASEGTYTIAAKLAQAPSAQQARVTLMHSIPRPIGGFPYGVAAVVFLIGTIITAKRRHHVTRGQLKALGAGSVLEVEGERYTIEEVRCYDEPLWPSSEPTYTFKLRGDKDAAIRWLSTDSLEEEYEDSEGNDQTRNHTYILLDVPLSARHTKTLKGNEEARTITLEGETYLYDSNNSGKVRERIAKDGQLYTSTYTTRAYRPMGGYPSEPNDRIIELVVSDDGEQEWSITRVVSWREVVFVERVLRDPDPFDASTDDDAA